MAAFLVRAFDLGAGSGSDVFEDDDGVLENAIDKLAAAGITLAKKRFASARRAQSTASKSSPRSARAGDTLAGGGAVRVNRSRICRCPPAGTSRT